MECRDKGKRVIRGCKEINEKERDKKRAVVKYCF